MGLANDEELDWEVSEQVSEALEYALGCLEALAEAGRELARRPTAELPAFEELAIERDAALLGLGQALANAVLEGWNVVLEPARSEAAPTVALVEPAFEREEPPDEADTQTLVRELVPEPVQLEEPEQPEPPSEPPSEDSLRALAEKLAPAIKEPMPQSCSLESLAREWGAPGDAIDVASLDRASGHLEAWMQLAFVGAQPDPRPVGA